MMVGEQASSDGKVISDVKRGGVQKVSSKFLSSSTPLSYATSPGKKVSFVPMDESGIA